MSKSNGNNYSIAAVEKSFSVLEYIVKQPNDVSAIEIHVQIGIPKASLHRILQTLKNMGYIDQNSVTTHYFPTMKSLQVAYYSINRHHFFETYYSYVMIYLRRYGLPCTLATYSGIEPVVVYSSIGKGDIIIDQRMIIGCTLPLHASSSGRLLLANLPRGTARDILSQIPLTPLTGNTLCYVDEIIESLDRIRNNGYCRLDGEVYYGHTNLSFPLYDVAGKLVGSFNMVVPMDQVDTLLPEETLMEIRNTLEKVRLKNN